MERKQVRGWGMEQTRVPRPKSEGAEQDSWRREGHRTEKSAGVAGVCVCELTPKSLKYYLIILL